MISPAFLQLTCVLGGFAFYLWSSRNGTCSDRNFIITMLIFGLSSFGRGLEDAIIPIDVGGLYMNLLVFSINVFFILYTIPSLLKNGE